MRYRNNVQLTLYFTLHKQKLYNESYYFIATNYYMNFSTLTKDCVMSFRDNCQLK